MYTGGNFRKQEHITQEKLAELCDTDTSYIGQIETRKRFPSLPFVEKIASVLHVQPYQLYKPQEQNSGSSSLDELQSEVLTAVYADITRLFSNYRQGKNSESR